MIFTVAVRNWRRFAHAYCTGRHRPVCSALPSFRVCYHSVKNCESEACLPQVSAIMKKINPWWSKAACPPVVPSFYKASVLIPKCRSQVLRAGCRRTDNTYLMLFMSANKCASSPYRLNHNREPFALTTQPEVESKKERMYIFVPSVSLRLLEDDISVFSLLESVMFSL